MDESVHEKGKEFQHLDLDFYLALSAYSQGQVVAQLPRRIRGLLQELIGMSALLPGDRELTCTQPAKILQALEERHFREARIAMRNHLGTSRQGYPILLRPFGLEPEGPRAGFELARSAC